MSIVVALLMGLLIGFVIRQQREIMHKLDAIEKRLTPTDVPAGEVQPTTSVAAELLLDRHVRNYHQR